MSHDAELDDVVGERRRGLQPNEKKGRAEALMIE